MTPANWKLEQFSRDSKTVVCPLLLRKFEKYACPNKKRAVMKTAQRGELKRHNYYLRKP
jgi:hypothetical protein